MRVSVFFFGTNSRSRDGAVLADDPAVGGVGAVDVRGEDRQVRRLELVARQQAEQRLGAQQRGVGVGHQHAGDVRTECRARDERGVAGAEALGLLHVGEVVAEQAPDLPVAGRDHDDDPLRRHHRAHGGERELGDGRLAERLRQQPAGRLVVPGGEDHRRADVGGGGQDRRHRAPRDLFGILPNSSCRMPGLAATPSLVPVRGPPRHMWGWWDEGRATLAARAGSGDETAGRGLGARRRPGVAMLAGDVRRRVDAVWDRLWAAGVTSPLAVAEHLSVLLVLAQLNGAGGPQCPQAWTWAALRREFDEGDDAAVRAVLAEVGRRFGIGAGASPALDAETLRFATAQVEALTLDERHRDILGEVYEHLLDHLSTAGYYGQFRTPRHLVRFVVEAVDPRPGDVVVDPAAGTGGFLVAAHERTPGAGGYRGTEVDVTLAGIARTNALLHGLERWEIVRGDGLAVAEADADVILANPPFAGRVAPGRAAGFESGTRRSELLFLEAMMRRLRPGGRAGAVVPAGVLESWSSGAAWVRGRLLGRYRLRAVVALPAGVFRPYTDVRTAVLVWENAPPADEVLLVDVRADGFTLDDRRTPSPHDDLPGALALLRGEDADVPHARVPVAVLREAGVLAPARWVRPAPAAAASAAAVAGAVRPVAPAGADDPWPLPAGWTVQPLAGRAEAVAGTVRAEDVDPATPYVGLEHIVAGTGECRPVPAGDANLRSPKRPFRAGDVLYGRLRPVLRKCAVAVQDGVCSTDIVVLRPRPGTAHVLAAQLRSPEVTARVVRLVGGASLPRVDVRDLLAMPLPVPPPEAVQAFEAEARAVVARRDRARALAREADAADRSATTRLLGLGT